MGAATGGWREIENDEESRGQGASSGTDEDGGKGRALMSGSGCRPRYQARDQGAQG